MAFDTPYVDMSQRKFVNWFARELLISTAGMCRGYAQANLVILPPNIDMLQILKNLHKNPFPCPILEIIKGTPELMTWVRAEISARISRIPTENGVFTKEITDASEYWKRDMLDFLSAVLSHLKLWLEDWNPSYRPGTKCTDVQNQHSDSS